MTKPFKQLEKQVVTFIRHCRHCEEIFKPNSKYNFVCEDCKEKLRAAQSDKYKKQRLLKQEQLRKLKVTK